MVSWLYIFMVIKGAGWLKMCGSNAEVFKSSLLFDHFVATIYGSALRRADQFEIPDTYS